MFKKILCPVDLKDLTKKHLSFARSFARDQNASLTALYVTHPPLYAYGYLMLEDLEARWDQVAQEKMREFCDSEIQILTGRGAVSDAVLEAISSSGFDLILMPTHGGNKEFFLGSTFQNVVNASTVPVLALPPILLQNEKVEFHKPSRILCAIEQPEKSTRVLETAGYLAMEFHASWSALHSIQLEEKFLDMIDFKKRQSIKQRVQDYLRQHIQFEQRLEEVIVTTGPADRQIANATVEKGFNFAVLGFIHSRLRLRTVLYRTILRMPVPCLCVPLETP